MPDFFGNITPEEKAAIERQKAVLAEMDQTANGMRPMWIEDSGVEPPKAGKLNMAAIPPMRQSIGESDVGFGDMVLSNDGIEPPAAGSLDLKAIPPMTRSMTQSDLDQSMKRELFGGAVGTLPMAQEQRKPLFRSWEQREAPQVSRAYTPAEGIGSFLSGIGDIMQRKDIGENALDRMRIERVAAGERNRDQTQQRADMLARLQEMRDPNADIANQELTAINQIRASRNMAPLPGGVYSYEVLRNNRSAFETAPVLPKQEGSAATKKMTGEQQDKLDKAAMAYKGILDVQNEIAKGGGPRRFEGIKQFFAGKTGFEEARDRYVEAFGRLQSGAAIGSAEDTRFKELLPTAQDSPQTLERKLVAMSNEMRARIGSLAGDPDQFMAKRFQYDLPVDVAARTEVKREEGKTAGNAKQVEPPKSSTSKDELGLKKKKV